MLLTPVMLHIRAHAHGLFAVEFDIDIKLGTYRTLTAASSHVQIASVHGAIEITKPDKTATLSQAQSQRASLSGNEA